MEKLSLAWQKICSVNYTYLLVLGLVIKSIAVGIDYPDFLISIPVLSFEAYKLYLKHKTPDPVAINAEVQRDLDGIKSKLNMMSMEKNMQAAPAKKYF